VADGVLGSPSWSANGQRVAFARTGEGGVLPGIYVITPDGLTGTRVASTGSNDSGPSLSPDGTKVSFARRVAGGVFPDPGVHDIVLASVNGGGPLETVVNHPADDTDPAWSPTADAIVYANNRNGNYDLFVTDTHGSVQSQLTSSPADERHPVWSPDGTRVAFERDGEIYVVRWAFNAPNPTPIRLGTGARPSWGRQPFAETPSGTNVAVQSENVGLTFARVGTEGETTIIPLDGVPSALPPGFFTVENTALSFEVQTTATFDPPIRVCITVSDDIDLNTFNTLRLLHAENGLLVDRTVFPLDFAARTICGEVTSLSPFHLVQAIDPALPRITGTVLEANGNPVARWVVNLGGGHSAQTTIDLEGNFTFANLTPGIDYTVQASGSGFDFSPDLILIENLTNAVAIGVVATSRVEPRLSAGPDPVNPGQILLRWPLSEVPYVLESAETLETTDWNPEITLTNVTTNSVTASIQPTNTARFFRLRRE
jgi:hypothetical protein